VAYAAVGDHGVASETLVDVAVDFTPERAVATLFVEVLDHHDARLGPAVDVRVVRIARVRLLGVRVRGMSGADRRGPGNPDHWSELRAGAHQRLGREPIPAT